MLASASSKVFSPPWTSHSKNVNGLLTPDGPVGNSVPNRKLDPIAEGAIGNKNVKYWLL